MIRRWVVCSRRYTRLQPRYFGAEETRLKPHVPASRKVNGIAFRAQDLVDVESIAARWGKSLDWHTCWKISPPWRKPGMSRRS
jgi:hypothetical protein